MKKIKYINCFGTSYTAGGGFEFGATKVTRRGFLKKYYNIKNEKQTQFNFSWPGRLQKLIKDNLFEDKIEVINYAKQGYGNERLYRKFYDVFSHHEFNSDEHIFLFEMSDLGRKEYWSNEVNSYVILNYEVDWDSEKLKKSNGLAKSWHYDSRKEFYQFELMEEYYYDFFSKTFNLKETISLMERNFLFFVSFLNENNIKYYFTSPPNFTDKNKLIDKFINFGDGKFTKSYNSFLQFCDFNNFLITNETPDSYIDDHCGFIGNNIVANEIYNFLIDKKEIELNKIKIDYEGLSKLDRQSFIKSKSVT